MYNTDFWYRRPTFVTGASGLMGGWLVKRLIDLGADVIVLVRDGVPISMLNREGLADQVVTVHGCVEDFSMLRRTMAEYSVATIFHLAAQPLVGVAKRDPLSTLEINVRGTWNVLEAARLTGVSNTVIASSDKAYGSSDCLPYLETHRIQAKYPYDVSKSCADLIAQMYAATYNQGVCIARCANLFGGGDLNFSRTIPGIILATCNGERFTIRSDGRFVRDFIYVKDAAEGYLRIAEKLASDPSLAGEAFNISLEVQLSVLQVTDMVLRIMGRPDLVPVILNQASSEIREQYMKCSKARQLLGWRPTYSMEHGLRETIDWYAAYFSASGQASVKAVAMAG